jgi:NAD(P)-dependent dehydrogenase (short-subunit alcohol dehydrogenase family)
MTLRGKVAVVTGGGGGIGGAMARRFAAEGARVLAVDRDAAALARLADLPSIRTVEADVATRAGADAVVAAAGPRVDVLCNNAGIADGLALVDELDEDVWDEVLAVNLTAMFLLCKRVVPLMVAQGGGVIINTSSVSGFRGGRAGPAYTASKYGVVGLSRNIAATFWEDGIRCIALAPGFTDTGMGRGMAISERGLERTRRDTVRPPTAPPDEIASVAVFLASDEARRINGALVVADGGLSAY